MKRILVLALILAGLGARLGAQQNPGDTPATKEDIERYFEVMHLKDMMTQMADAMTKPMHQMIHQQFLKDKDKLPPDFEERTNHLIDDYMKGFPWGEMMDATVPIYQKHLTKNDVDALLAFYSTPTGQKLIKEIPKISAEAMQTMMPLIQKNLESLRHHVQEEVETMAKDSPSRGTAATPQKD